MLAYKKHSSHCILVFPISLTTQCSFVYHMTKRGTCSCRYLNARFLENLLCLLLPCWRRGVAPWFKQSNVYFIFFIWMPRYLLTLIYGGQNFNFAIIAVAADIRVHEFFKTSYFKKGIHPIPGARQTLQKLSRFCNLSVVTYVCPLICFGQCNF